MTIYFPNVKSRIQFDPKADKNHLLVFRHYDPEEIVAGKTMEEWLRFAVCYWHTFCGNGADPFGAPTLIRSWNKDAGTLNGDLAKAEAAFEFMKKLGVTRFCFHDRDIATEQSTLRETEDRLDLVVARIQELMEETGI